MRQAISNNASRMPFGRSPVIFLLSATMLLAGSEALATCPDPATVDATTFEQRGYAVGYDCVAENPSAPLPSSCADSRVVVPPGAPSLPADRRLFLFLPGGNNTPSDLNHIPMIGAFAGMPSIAVSWDNDNFSDNTYCLLGGYMGGLCDATQDCLEAARNEKLYGIDLPITDGGDNGDAYHPSRLNSVLHRTAAVLNELAADPDPDVMAWDFEDFCTPDPEHGTQLLWERIVVGGFSQGAQQAAYISYTQSTAGTFLIEGGSDTCERTALDPGEPSPYYTELTDASDGSIRFAALHTGSFFGPVIPSPLPPSFPYLDLGPEWWDYDAFLAGNSGGTGTTGDTGALTTYESVLVTSQNSAIGCPGVLADQSHRSMATTECMPTPPANLIATAGPATRTLKLFQGYFSAFCEVLQ